MSEYPVWVNGVPESFLPVSDRGLAYGDGLFETVRVAGGKPTLADYHWRRLQRSCQQLGIAVDIERLLEEVDAFLLDNRAFDGVLKVMITRGSGGRGYNPEGCLSVRRILSLHPLPSRSRDPGVHGARVKLCQMRLGRSALAGLKHLNRLEQVLARSEWQGDAYDEGLLCDFEGNLVEGTMSNLFIVTHEGDLVTPDLSFHGVAGVCREFIIEFARHRGMTVKEQSVPRGLDVAEIFLCNSVNGVWPVIEYEGREWGIGPLTSQIRDCVLEEFNA
ncbi:MULTISPECIES: aminodeoxychorismate lyase [Gammaproteobacteria]|uniref:aminodeoxychorismate lyase n=1 Tax=Gammaproteobacteria TaxID=1236 RepID=UPI001AD95D62|nr:aminodeoxychorismate lyase [Salinisphaera sp. G21_0]MBO9494553.1 aminodeoxychorismate lyase [Thalassotalea sp. G20_0]